jgi:hypothetical protein
MKEWNELWPFGVGLLPCTFSSDSTSTSCKSGQNIFHSSFDSSLFLSLTPLVYVVSTKEEMSVEPSFKIVPLRSIHRSVKVSFLLPFSIDLFIERVLMKREYVHTHRLSRRRTIN